MSTSATAERRASIDAEHDTVRRSHRPAVHGLSRGGPPWCLRERCDRARDAARRRRREMRDKADPHGTAASGSGDDAGIDLEAQASVGAPKRVNDESVRHTEEEKRAPHVGSMGGAPGRERARIRHHLASGRAAGEGLRPPSVEPRSARADTA